MNERRNLPRREFVEQYFPYIRNMIIRMGRSLPPDMEFNDLLNSAVIGLITSIDRYDPEKNDSFISFAHSRIRGSILDTFRKHDKLTRTSRDLVKRYEKAKLHLANNNETEPDFGDVVEYLKLKTEQIRSLAVLLTPDESLRRQVEELVNSPETILEKINTKDIIKIRLPDAINHLNEKEQKVITSYFYNKETLKEISEELNLTESRISQIKKAAVNKLKTKLKVIENEI